MPARTHSAYVTCPECGAPLRDIDEYQAGLCVECIAIQDDDEPDPHEDERMGALDGDDDDAD